MHTAKEKIKKRENENKDPVMVMNHSQQSPLTTTEDNTQTTKEILQKQRFQEGNNAQALSSSDYGS
jgi:hypothetical protein